MTPQRYLLWTGCKVHKAIRRQYVWLLTFIGLLTQPTRILAQPQFLTDGLVAYYPFSGNANDKSGNSNDGTIVGAVLVQDRFGSMNSSYSFDGNSYISAGKIARLGSGKQCTVSVWFRVGSPPEWESIISLGSYNDPNGWGLIARKNQIFLRSGDLGNTPTGYGVLTEYNFQPNQWYHCAFTVSETEVILYVNGAILKTVSTTPDKISLSSSNALLIGKSGTFAQFPYYLNGAADDVRIYNRALSASEVSAVYEYESVLQQASPRIAAATAIVVNGFVVDALITDTGAGYTDIPVVKITGGGGTGATATATIGSGQVTKIKIESTGSGYLSPPSISIDPPPFPPRRATGNSQIVNGFVVGVTVADGGFGYDSAPAVLILGGGGSGAKGTATVVNGVVTGITISAPGSGYFSEPTVRIASPPFAPRLSIEVSRVRVTLQLVLGRRYQLESSIDLLGWSAIGGPFIAETEEMVQEFEVSTTGRFFRINQVP